MPDEIPPVEQPIEDAQPDAIDKQLSPIAPDLIKPPKITDRDKENFFKAFLIEEPFTETAELFQKKFKVTFKTLSLSENDDIIKQIAIDQKADKANNTDSYFIEIMNFRLALSIININDVPFQPDIKPVEGYVREKAKIFKSWPAFKVSALTEAFRSFEAKINKLTEEVHNENFW